MPASANNYRPPQPLNGREIFDVLAVAAAPKPATAAISALALCFFAAKMF